MKSFNRIKPYFNIKHINEISAWATSGFTYFPHGEPDEIIDNGDTRIQKFYHEETGTQITVSETFYEGIRAVKQINTVTKTEDKPCVINQFSSALLNGIPFLEYEDIVIHYTDFAWQTEAQWHKMNLAELGMHPGGNHGITCVKSFAGKGTFSTDSHYPMIIAENIKTNEAYFFELETSTSWYIELGIKSHDGKNVLYIEGNCAFQNHDGWHIDLKKGEAYTAAPAVWGVVAGGFNEAVNELLKYKRAVSEVGFKEKIPVVFNNYMNSIWCNQTAEKNIPLIDAAAEAGADIYCMDAGWYTHFGDWVINEEKFGEMKLQGIIDYIKSKGMKAGIWLEAEACHRDAEAYKTYYDAVYKSCGTPIGGERLVMDFRNEAFRNHIEKTVDMLYNMGIRYIKNDYNKNAGMFIDGDLCASRELREANLAFYSFIEAVNKKYPDLIIENCGSGAMRCDNGILKYFSLQSTSDLEYYHYYPSVMIGMNACVPLEKAGIWSYPYPHFYGEQKTEDLKYFNEKYINERKDGRETVFNMVTSMLGCMYLSGRIDKCDEYNFSLVKEAVEVYKSYCGDIKNSYPLFTEYPINTKDSYNTSFGLINYCKKTVILGVWSYNGDMKYTVDLKNNAVSAEMLYPSSSKIKYELSGNKLHITFDGAVSAGIFKINL